MHVVDVSVGHLGSTSIVGGGIPIGTGLGLSIQMKGGDGVSVVYFSDGAADEGVLYESLNFAMLKRLPVVYIYENNQYSVCSHITARQAGEIIFHQTPPDLLHTSTVDGNDILDVYEAAGRAVDHARAGKGPSFMECKTYRLRGHAGSYSDAKLGYRTEEEIAAWEARCPLARFKNHLTERGVLDSGEIARMEESIQAEIEDAFAFAAASPLPGRDDLFHYLYKEKELENALVQSKT
jgi:pyruvate dehydrogenase E1 component alpha subunit